MGCPGCGHMLDFDFSKGRPACRHCAYPDLPDDIRLYGDKSDTGKAAGNNTINNPARPDKTRPGRGH